VSNVGVAVTFLSPSDGPDDRFRESVQVLVQDLPFSTMTLRQYADTSLSQATSQIPDFTLLSSNPTLLADREAQRVIYRGQKGGYVLEWEQVWLVDRGRGYTVTLTAELSRFATVHATAEAVIESFALD
jgi:hypothetical protein